MRVLPPSCERVRLGAWMILGLALVSSGAALADDVFKCRDAQGLLSYQDKPCPPGTEQPAPLLMPAPDFAPPLLDQPASKTSPPSDGGNAYRTAPPAPPTQYRCTDAVSGKTYVTANLPQSGRYVPFWTVAPGAINPRPRDGGMRPAPPPVTGAPQPQVAASYTYVEDRCRPMPLGELCGYWRSHIDEVHGAKRTAFNDTRPQLEQEEDGLRDQLATYCGR